MAMSSLVRPILPHLEATESPRQPAALPDDLLEEILVRVTSPADLARASTACISFHCLITDPIFLRRYRSLHPPLFLGLINVNGDDASFEPAEAPLPGAAAGRAIARAADFSFRYVPRGRSGGRWCPYEVYDGRVLLECSCPDPDGKVVLPDLAVCDPLSRRYLLLPPIPDGQSYEQNLEHYCVFFAPSVDEDDETSFRVIMSMHCTQELVVIVFSSGSGRWSVSTSTSWDTLSLSLSRLTGLSQNIWVWPSYAHNCLFWKVDLTNKLVMLNMNTKKFSTVNLPHEHEDRITLIVEEGNGMLGMFSHHDTSALAAHYYTSVPKEGKIAIEWQLKNIIPMPIVNCRLYFICQPQRHIFLADYTSGCFTLDFKTMTFERVNRKKCELVQPYLGYPPSMSPRRI